MILLGGAGREAFIASLGGILRVGQTLQWASCRRGFLSREINRDIEYGSSRDHEQLRSASS